MRKAKVDPWLQIEFHMQPEEWLALVEYMAASYDPKVDSPTSRRPWALICQGQVRPWTDEFVKIFLELGNETWNSMFRPSTSSQ